MHKKLVAINTDYSPVNTLLRNPLRVLNHIGLITDKQAIGTLLGLENGSDNLSILDNLQVGAISTKEALMRIAEKRSLDIKEVMNRLLRVYQTGLLEFHITDVCDLDCVDCHYRNKGNATVPFSQIRPILARLQPKAITITGGGEPNVYSSEGKNFHDVVLEIRRALPNASLGLINNNTKIVEGPWTKHIMWQRTSVDTSNAGTYFAIKRKDKYEQVLANVKQLLTDSDIPYVGIGFLYRPENIAEISDFLKLWHSWFKQQPTAIQKRFNIQFRPIAAQINEVTQVRSGSKNFISENVQAVFNEQIQAVLQYANDNPDFEKFIRLNTNFGSMVGKNLNGLHQSKPFSNCFNAFAHRVFRSTGEEYPDFLLPNFPGLSLGNTLLNGDDDVFRVALLQFWYFNKRSPFCNAESCRQSWVSNLVENHLSGKILRDSSITNDFF